MPGSDVALPAKAAVAPGEDDYSSNIQVADLKRSTRYWRSFAGSDT